MDIASILAAADDEVAYEQDTFEAVPHVDDSQSNFNNSSQNPSNGIINDSKPLSVSDVLKSAAQAVAKEEQLETAAALAVAATSVHSDLIQQEKNRSEKENNRHDNRNRDEEDVAMRVLLEAADEVNDLHKINESKQMDYSKNDEKQDDGKEQEEEEDNEYSRDIDTDLEDEWDENEETFNENQNDDALDDDTSGATAGHCSSLQKELLFAAYHGQSGRVETLLRQMPRPNDYLVTDRHGWDACHWATARGHCVVLETLLAHHRSRGGNVRKLMHRRDTTRVAGWTLLHVAAVCGQLQVAQLLLQEGASVRKKDHLGEFPFEVIGKYRTAKQLLRLLHPKPLRHLLTHSGTHDDTSLRHSRNRIHDQQKQNHRVKNAEDARNTHTDRRHY